MVPWLWPCTQASRWRYIHRALGSHLPCTSVTDCTECIGPGCSHQVGCQKDSHSLLLTFKTGIKNYDQILLLVISQIRKLCLYNTDLYILKQDFKWFHCFSRSVTCVKRKAGKYVQSSKICSEKACLHLKEGTNWFYVNNQKNHPSPRENRHTNTLLLS